MMQNSLDSLNAMGSWQTSADKAFEELREKVEGMATTLEAVSKWVDLAATRMDSIESRLTMAPATPQHLPSLKIMDLN